NRFIEGWSVSGIGTVQSGRPFSIIDSDYSGFLYASPNPRPSIKAGSTYADLKVSGSAKDNVGGYLNADAIESAGAQFGNLGRNILRGPVQRRLDLSVFKITPLTERVSLELRGEFYNLTNTVNLRNPANDFSSGDFGEITETVGGPRLVQFAAKLRF